VRRDVIHADFFSIDITKPIEVEVPIEFTGVAPAVKLTGGSLVKKMDEIKVRCLPKDFAKFVTVPVDGLVTLEDVISIKDVVVPSTWEILDNPEDLVATVVPPRIETFDVKPADAEAAVVAAVNAAPAAKEGEAAKTEEKKK
jgi:large subunit ribosomal protein L25